MLYPWGEHMSHMSTALSFGSKSELCWIDKSDFPFDWNGPIDRPFESFPDEAKARPIIELLEAVVRRYPERIALVGPEGSITYLAHLGRLGAADRRGDRGRRSGLADYDAFTALPCRTCHSIASQRRSQTSAAELAAGP